MIESTYQIKLPQFEGPFDLLLFFIERDELDIYDIPISKLTGEFLSYIHEAGNMNIELASEFILVAATLMRIKAKLLLPRKELDEQGKEIDPRKELIDRLLEYKRYKEVMDDMRALEYNRGKIFERSNVQAELKSIADSIAGEAELHTLSIFKMMKAFEKVMNRFEEEKKRPVHKVIRYPYTIEESKDIILNKVRTEHNVSFARLFDICGNRVHAIFTFLGLLELIQQRLVQIQVGMGSNNFWLNPAESVAN
jgi:segregation and condensation protein A